MRNKPTILFDDPCDIEEDDEDHDVLGWREEEDESLVEDPWEEESFDEDDTDSIFNEEMAQLTDGNY